MADNLIRWKRSDYARLSKAVNKYNKQINELAKAGYEYLPEVKNYQSLKNDILTRKELNRLVNSLKKFSIETAKQIELESGIKMTEWEYKEIKLARNRARRFLETRLEEQEILNPYAKFGLETKEIEQTKATIQSLSKLETQQGKFESNRLIERIKNLGRYDANMIRAKRFKENYMKALEQMSNYDNYDLLKKKLNSIKNPEQFYEYVSQSTTLNDLFNYYESSPEAQTYGGYSNNQEAFNKGLEELGLFENIELTDLTDQIVHIL